MPVISHEELQFIVFVSESHFHARLIFKAKPKNKSETMLGQVKDFLLAANVRSGKATNSLHDYKALLNTMVKSLMV